MPAATNDSDQTGIIPALQFDGDTTCVSTIGIVGSAAPFRAGSSPQSGLGHHQTPGFPDLGTRYRPVRKLGQGGMGAVYLCDDMQTHARVAVKVLPAELNPDAQTVQRFQKESRLLAEVQHANVANLLDSGIIGNTRYLVMELVEGTDLKAVVQELGPLPEQVALQIVFDVASALTVAHELGIVHRDIKPGNILLTANSVSELNSEQAVFNAVRDAQPFITKLTDFGLARHVDQAASLELTRTGMMLGTPYYISPEQCTDKGGITPATDIYSLGATLYELLTGRPPFRADDPIKLISMHCFEQAPDPRKIRAEISDGAATLIARTLQKSPSERYADAGHLLADLTRLLHGEATSGVCHPSVPKPTGKVFAATWEWQLDSNPAELWPHVSNTERVNAAVGLPSVEYVTRRDERGVKHRFGSFKLGWTRLSWEEHPFEWIEGRRFSILREFENGPFQWFVSTVELIPRPEGGSLLRHSVRIATHGLIGRLIAHIEVNIKGRKPLDRVYRRIDDVVSGKLKSSSVTDPFVATSSAASKLRRKLENFRSQFVGNVSDQNCLERFLDLLAESPAQDLARIRPRAVARRLDVSADQLTILCLEACHAGLLELHWDILCPTCRVAAAVKDSLNEIDRHARCEACEHDFDADFTSAVEMIFRVHPDLRQADLKTYCVGGPEHAPHVIAQIQVAAGESFELDLNLDPGSYVLRGSQLPYTIGIVADSSSGPNRSVIRLRPDQSSRRSIRIHGERQLLTLVNEYSCEILIRLERTTPRKDVVTAAEALQLPLFRQLFPSEAVTRDRLSSMSTCTLMALRITNVLDLFSVLSDAATATSLQQTMAFCRITIEARGGVLIKEQEDRLMASFAQAQPGLQSAIELHEALSAECSATRTAPAVQIALHRGVAMSTSINGKLDFVGRSVAIVSAMLDLPEKHRLLVSQDLASDEEFQANLHNAGRTSQPVSRSGGLTILEISGVQDSAEQSTVEWARAGKHDGKSGDHIFNHNGQCSPHAPDPGPTGMFAYDCVISKTGEAK
jgi:serine/threonine protein kinase